MVRIEVRMRGTLEPVKRTAIALHLDASQEVIESTTDRNGKAEFEIAPVSGKIKVDGITRYCGRLDGDILIELWSTGESSTICERGAPPGSNVGSIAYPSMQTRSVRVNGQDVSTDMEGYLVDLDDWSEDFVRAEAKYEELALTSEHWEVIRYLRKYFEQHQVQCTVRDLIVHFKKVWGSEKGSNRYLHQIFPKGGPQKQGNRLAGLLRTKGEH